MTLRGQRQGKPTTSTAPTPPTTVRFTRHDRRHAEVKLEYPTPSVLAERQDVMVDVWFFLPPASGVGPDCYSAPAFFDDLHARTRLKTPVARLVDLARLDGPGSPLATLSILCMQVPTGKVPKLTRQSIRREGRLLSCMYRRAARDALAQIEPGDDECEAFCGAFVDQTRTLQRHFRRLTERLSATRIGDDTRGSLIYSDEALSVDVEAAALGILEIVGPHLGGAASHTCRALAALVADERAHREARGDRSAAKADAKDRAERAVFYDQASLLKKYTSQVLYLNSERNGGMHRLEQIALAFAAGTAMLWTVSLQFATLFWFDLQLDLGVTPRVAVIFTLITVMGYVLKDRIKAWTGRQLAVRLPRLLYDRRLDLYKDDDDKSVGSIREKMCFDAKSSLPGSVRKLRQKVTRSRLALWTGAPILHYERLVRIRPARAAMSFPRLAGLTDILRFDIAAWTRQFDNHQKYITVLGDDATAVRTRAPNHYIVDVIIRICQDEGEDQLEAHRMVLTRRGIEEITPLPAPELAPASALKRPPAQRGLRTAQV